MVDLGSGPGYLASRLSQEFPGSEVIGLDISEETLELAIADWPANYYRNIQFCCGDVERLPFKDGVIDIIISSLSLHHWRNPKKAVLEINRVLKPGGQFLIMDLRRDARRFYYYVFVIGQLFAPAALRRINGAVGSFWSSYTPEELDGLLSEASFEDMKIKPQFGWMFAFGSKWR